MEKIKSFIQKYWAPLSYLFFGVLTTAVSYGIFLPCYNLLKLSATVSNLLSWVAAVLFAYLTNKPFVFKSHDWSLKTVLPEFAKFVSCRIASGVVETGMLLLFVDILGGNGNVWKIIASVVVVILNYIGSKLVVFRK